MKVFLFGRNTKNIEALILESGFKITTENPEYIVVYGGDGSLMKAEGIYPGIPKILLRDSAICKKCSPLPNEEVLKRIKDNSFAIEKLMKLEVSVAGKTLHAVNDIILHNKDSRHAIRYSLSVNGKVIGNSIIGDGVVVSTPFGSTGYYRSITDSYFELGIGVAFNNSTEQSDHIVLKEDKTIDIKMSRGPAIIYADNQDEFIEVDEGAEIKIKKSLNTASIVIPKN